MNEQQTEKDDLEYNDGLGDLLREKDSMQFSWAKTISVIVVLALLVTLGLWAFFKSTGDKDAHETNYANDITETETTPTELTPTADVATDGHIENENIKGETPVAGQEVDNTHVDEVIKKLMADQKAAQKREDTTKTTPQPTQAAPAHTAPAAKQQQAVKPTPAAPAVTEVKRVVSARPVAVERRETERHVTERQVVERQPEPRKSTPRLRTEKPKRVIAKKVEKAEVAVSTATTSYYRVVVGIYANRAEADAAILALGEHSVPGFVRPLENGQYNVQTGAFQSLDKATQQVQLLRSKGYKAKVESKK